MHTPKPYISLIIPTHNRHHYLDRILEYYKNSNIEIWVLDSSVEPYRKEQEYDIEYIHMPHATPAKKIQAGLQKATSNYVVVCADDDFIAKKSLHTCVKYLEQNTDYACVQGAFFKFSESEGQVKIQLDNPYSLLYSHESDKPLQRLQNGMKRYMHTFYAVQRTSDARKIWNTIHNISRYNLFEIAQSSALLLMGKYKMLPIVYGFREEAIVAPSDDFRENLDVIVKHEVYKKEYENVLEFLLELLKEQYSSEKVNTEQIDKAIRHYISDFLPWYFNKYQTPSFIDKIPLVRRYYHNYLKKRFNNSVLEEISRLNIEVDEKYKLKNKTQNSDIQEIISIILQVPVKIEIPTT